MAISETKVHNIMLNMQLRGLLPMDDSAQPCTKGGVTFLGKMDRDLSAGKIPGDLDDIYVRDFQEHRSNYRRQVLADIIPGCAFGAIVGMSFSEIPALASSLAFTAPFVCGAAGVVAGAAVAWLRRKGKSSGNVSVNIDGKKFSQPWYMSPDRYSKSPEMIKFIMTAKGVLGDRIGAHALKDGDVPATLDDSKLKELKGYSKSLAGLAKERRLVADFGEKSLYGRDALHLIDGNLARDLIAGGKNVYVVNGRETKQIPHHYVADMTRGNNTSHITTMTEVYDYLETKLDYSLTPISSPADLARIEKGTGIPEGILGVYGKSDSYSEVVFRDKQYGYADINKGPRKSSEVIKYDHSNSTKVSEPAISASDSVYPRFVHRFNLPFFLGMIGAVAGGMMAVGFGIQGLPAGTMMATGFLAGRFIGGKIMR